jgi:hypothetical protein
MEGETVYGAFTALAESGLPGPFGSVTPLDSTSTIGFSMTPAGGSTPVFTASNVDTPSGTAVPAQTPGSYQATWTLSGPNGDTRVVTTRFIEEPANQGPKGDPGPQGPKGDPGPPGPKPHIRCKLVSKKHHHRSIKCKVTYHKNGRAKDHVALRVQRGSRIMALGQAALHRGSASLTMRMIRTRARGAWSVTVVLQRARGAATTTTSRIRMG